ncbi:hypothetical protein HYW87_02865 [Candidatus Roizmanbacteria bacterium]|nr:hypothetical protein [Candidatus Roizmanbacteria bacterium]
MGVKDRRTKILLSLFLLSDVNFNFVTLSESNLKIFDLYLNQKTRGTLSGLMREGLIEKQTSEVTSAAITPTGVPLPIQTIATEGVYRLTENGFHALCLQFPFFRFLRDRWDGKWRILSYEIPEKKRELRDKLRREVVGWGLGPWHRSFWVTPHPIIENLKELVSQKEEEEYLQAFEADHVFGDKETFIEKVWQKSTLDKKYRDLFKKWHDIIASGIDKTEKFKQIIALYVDVIRNDSGLPKELVGEKWIGFEAFTIFKEIRSILL